MHTRVQFFGNNKAAHEQHEQHETAAHSKEYDAIRRWG